MNWREILKAPPQLHLTGKKYDYFKRGQALDSLNRILRKDPAKTLYSDVGFRGSGIRGGRSKRPFVHLTTDTALQSETLKELRDSGFYVSIEKDKDEAGQVDYTYYIRGESFSGTRNIEPTEEERRAITSRKPKSAKDEIARREENLRQFVEERDAKEERRLSQERKERRKLTQRRQVEAVTRDRKKFEEQLKEREANKKKFTPEEIQTQEKLIQDLKQQRESLTGAKAKKMRKRIENEERKLKNMR